MIICLVRKREARNKICNQQSLRVPHSIFQTMHTILTIRLPLFIILRKNWDEESSDEEHVSESEILARSQVEGEEIEGSKSRKKRRTSRSH